MRPASGGRASCRRRAPTDHPYLTLALVPILHAIILGLVQGLTEFLPVSSSGHLEIVPWLFKWNDLGGNAELDKAFDVALHIGTFVGAFAYFRTDIVTFARAGLRSIGRRRVEGTDERLAWFLLLSAVPAAIAGALLEDFIDSNLGAIWIIAVMLIVFAVVLLIADRLPGRRDLDELRWRDALLLGAAQAAALQPGVSRSGATISMGRALGFSRDSAARVSFLMSLPIIAGAGVYKGLDVMRGSGIPADFLPPFAAGMLTAGITGWLAVWGTLRLIRTRSFLPFVVYRVVAGVSVLALYFARL